MSSSNSPALSLTSNSPLDEKAKTWIDVALLMSWGDGASRVRWLWSTAKKIAENVIVRGIDVARRAIIEACKSSEKIGNI